MVNPTISVLVPNAGTIAGGTPITINGTGFVAGATVTIDGVACTSVVVVSAIIITAVTPSGTTGAKDVVVTNADTGFGTKSGGFTYVINPTVDSISPDSGSIDGGTHVTITGTGFVAGAIVNIGSPGPPCTDIVVVSSTEITCVTQSDSAGPADVVVLNPDTGEGTLVGGFNYAVGGYMTTNTNHWGT